MVQFNTLLVSADGSYRKELPIEAQTLDQALSYVNLIRAGWAMALGAGGNVTHELEVASISARPTVNQPNRAAAVTEALQRAGSVPGLGADDLPAVKQPQPSARMRKATRRAKARTTPKPRRSAARKK